MRVFEAINGAVKDIMAAAERREFAEMHGILNSLGQATQEWLPYNDGYFYRSYLLTDDSVPGRLVFDTTTLPPEFPARAAMRRYRTVVHPGPVAASIQIEGPPALPGERAQLLGAIEKGFIEALSRELPDETEEEGEPE